MKSSPENATSNAPPSPAGNRGLQDMLTPAEIEELRRDKVESGEFFKKAFEHLRPKTPAAK